MFSAAGGQTGVSLSLSDRGGSPKPTNVSAEDNSVYQQQTDRRENSRNDREQQQRQQAPEFYTPRREEYVNGSHSHEEALLPVSTEEEFNMALKSESPKFFRDMWGWLTQPGQAKQSRVDLKEELFREDYSE